MKLETCRWKDGGGQCLLCLDSEKVHEEIESRRMFWRIATDPPPYPLCVVDDGDWQVCYKRRMVTEGQDLTSVIAKEQCYPDWETFEDRLYEATAF